MTPLVRARADMAAGASLIGLKPSFARLWSSLAHKANTKAIMINHTCGRLATNKLESLRLRLLAIYQTMTRRRRDAKVTKRSISEASHKMSPEL